MYYSRLGIDVTGLDPLVVIEDKYPRDEVVIQDIKIGKSKKVIRTTHLLGLRCAYSRKYVSLVDLCTKP